MNLTVCCLKVLRLGGSFYAAGINTITNTTNGTLMWGLLLFSHYVMSDSLWPWTAAPQASLSFTVSQRLLRLMSTESVMLSNHLIFCHPLLLLPSIFPSMRIFSSESALCIRLPESWSFNIQPSNEYSVLIFFRIDWFDLLAVPGALKSLLQYHNSKAGTPKIKNP